MKIYFDNAATTFVCKEAADAVLSAMTDTYGNPSSLHLMGMDAENIVKNSRGEISKKLDVPAECIYFTSGGTESNNTAIFGACLKTNLKGNRIITTKAEHPAVLEPFKVLAGKGFDVQYVNLLPSGTIDLSHLESLLTPDTVFVSIMGINNETGCIMPMTDAVSLIRKKSPNALIHSDIVQAFCKVSMANVDLASVSSHKVHGPKGVGALYIKKGVHINPLMFGGGQEKAFRSGTENVPGIAGFGAAVKKADMAKDNEHTAMLKSALINAVSDIPDIRINGEDTSSHVLNVSFKGVRSEVFLHTLESNGIMVSSGSACSSNKPSPSHVLTAMGVDSKSIDSAIRFSFSVYNTIDEINYCADVIKRELPILRRIMR
ncbi:MAG: cysteine desulfurase [Clostridia bacterium]|nr:cysteine desulfurase [Clostridia bacterium]